MKNYATILIVLVAMVTKTQAQWHETSPVSSNSQNIYSLASDGVNIFAGTGSAGISLSSNGGSIWTTINNGITNTCISAIAVSGSNVFAGGDSGVFLSANKGTLWTPVSNGLPKTTIEAFAVSGDKIFVGTHTNGVYLSTTNGNLWTPANTGFIGQVQAFAFNGTKIFAGAANNGVYLSVNNGGLWTAVNAGLINKDVHALAAIGSSIFAGTSGGVFLSTNDGTSWTPVNNGLTDTVVNALLVNGAHIFAGTNNGVFYSGNNGANWVSISEGFPAKSIVWTLTISGTNLFAGMHLEPYGVWKRPLSEVTGINEMMTGGNIDVYPNPSGDRMTITLPENMDKQMEVNIISIYGQEILRQKISNKNAGNITLDISQLKEGIYSLLVYSGNQTFYEKKIIVAR